jgi:chromosome segregation ATPase
MTESEHNSTEAGELNRRLRETQHSYETLSQQSYNLQTSLGDFSRMLNEFIISSETKSVAELQECLNGFK